VLAEQDRQSAKLISIEKDCRKLGQRYFSQKKFFLQEISLAIYRAFSKTKPEQLIRASQPGTGDGA
jgi:hypothetical protein